MGGRSRKSVFGIFDNADQVLNTTHRRELREQDKHTSRKVDKEQLGIILDIMSRDQEAVQQGAPSEMSLSARPKTSCATFTKLTGRSERSSTISWPACIERPHRSAPTT